MRPHGTDERMLRIEDRAAQIAAVFIRTRDRVEWVLALRLAAAQLEGAVSRGVGPHRMRDLGLGGQDGPPEPRAHRAHVDERV